jgi:hypothetical protein
MFGTLTVFLMNWLLVEFPFPVEIVDRLVG